MITLPGRDRKTVKKLLIDAKIPRRNRDALPVFDCEGVVCASLNLARIRRFCPSQASWPGW